MTIKEALQRRDLSPQLRKILQEELSIGEITPVTCCKCREDDHARIGEVGPYLCGPCWARMTGRI